MMMSWCSAICCFGLSCKLLHSSVVNSLRCCDFEPQKWTNGGSTNRPTERTTAGHATLVFISCSTQSVLHFWSKMASTIHNACVVPPLYNITIRIIIIILRLCVYAHTASPVSTLEERHNNNNNNGPKETKITYAHTKKKGESQSEDSDNNNNTVAYNTLRYSSNFFSFFVCPIHPSYS